MANITRNREKVDIRQLDNLNELFLKVVSNIFLSDYSNEAFNEITGAQQRIMLALGVNGPQKMSDLARLISVTLSGATGIVDRMVRAGLVVRESDPQDRRIIRITLTPSGKVHERRFEEVLAALSPAKRERLIESFKQIHELLMEVQSANENPN